MQIWKPSLLFSTQYLIRDTPLDLPSFTMSLIQSIASVLPKWLLVRWLTPATLSTSSSHVFPPQCRTTRPRHTRQINPSQFRTYALRTNRAPSPSLKANSKSSGDLLFSSEEHVPPLDFWKSRLETLNPNVVTAEDCLYAAESYCEIAVRNSSTWKGRLQRGMPISTSPFQIVLLSSGTLQNRF